MIGRSSIPPAPRGLNDTVSVVTCPHCGRKIKRCPNGHIVPEGARFCPVCGAKIE